MAPVYQFVADMTSASPSVLLDLNAAGMQVLRDVKLGPASYEKGYAASPLRHGKRLTRSVAGNQILELPIEISTASEALTAQAIENLGRQLSIDNILKIQMDGGTPVFYRTFADPDFTATLRRVLARDTTVVLSIEAEPFAYGPRIEVTGSPFTVSNDPAAGTNPMRFDITGVLGDVETPLLLIATSTGATNGLVSKWTHVGTRRRGTPGNYSNVIQGEDMTQGTGAVVTADAAMSNGSKSRIGYATATNVLRLSDTFPGNGTSTVEARGEYTVYGRFAKTVAGDTITVQLGYGASSAAPVFNDTVTLPASAAGPYWVNLGKVPVPMWSDPGKVGFSGVQSKVQLPFVGLYSARTAGTGSLDVDCLYFMPADDSTVIVKWPSTDTTYVLDATSAEGGSAYAMTTALDEVIATESAPQVVSGGGFPELIPGQTNRIHVIRQVDPAGTVDGITNTTTVRAYYWPRWREFTRP